MKISLLGSLTIACLILMLNPATANPRKSQALPSEWNAAVLTVAEKEDGFLTLKGVRTLAMLHLAMHDALSNVNANYESYVYVQPTPEANAIAAASSAAFHISISQYPDEAKYWQSLKALWLDPIPESPAKETGVVLGRESANAVLQSRADDGWDTAPEYQWHPMAPGVYAEFADHSGTPQGFIFGTGWGKARGFAISSPNQFRAPPPPPIASDRYTEAFNEVKTVGRFQSMQRTADQTHLALWWKDFAENSHNRLARDLIAKEQLSLAESTRLLALVNMSIFDAYVSVFENKFHYNHWRPYTAIRWAANDGNPNTEPEDTWTNTHRHTYAFPSYPSAHGTACTAAMTAFAEVFGDDYRFTMQTPVVDIAGPFSGKIEMQPASREFTKFSDAAMECSLSRVYLGIHFRYDSIAGYELGQKIGKEVVDKYLEPKG